MECLLDPVLASFSLLSIFMGLPSSGVVIIGAPYSALLFLEIAILNVHLCYIRHTLASQVFQMSHKAR